MEFHEISVIKISGLNRAGVREKILSLIAEIRCCCKIVKFKPQNENLNAFGCSGVEEWVVQNVHIALDRN